MRFGEQFLGSCFTRRLEWVEQEDGRVVVLRPRFGESGLGKRLAAWLGFSDYKIRLDEIGTRVWQCCDGRTPAREIAEHLRSEFGERIEPAEERLFTFMAQMNRSRMIEPGPGLPIPGP